MSHRKVLFRLERDAEGYPPAEVEGVWAEELDDGGYRIDNIPFFTREVTLGDTIEVLCSDDECFYAATRKPSTNSLVRVVLFDGHPAALVRSELLRLGCDSELSHLNSLISVNVPATVDIEVIRHFLDAGCTNGLWDYEEPILRQ